MARSVMLYDDSLHDRIKRIAMSISVRRGERVTIQEAIAAGIQLLEKEFPEAAQRRSRSNDK